MTPRKPTRQELQQAKGATLPDIIAPGLRILFCGINPGLYSAAVGHNFARPGNRFWPTLHRAGLTPRLFQPDEEQELPVLGIGITNVVERATARAEELTPEELVAGGQRLIDKVRACHPRVLAILGVTAYRAAFAKPKAVPGRQPERIDDTIVWVLPNPSGLNAHYRPHELAEWFRTMAADAE